MFLGGVGVALEPVFELGLGVAVGAALLFAGGEVGEVHAGVLAAGEEVEGLLVEAGGVVESGLVLGEFAELKEGLVIVLLAGDFRGLLRGEAAGLELGGVLEEAGGEDLVGGLADEAGAECSGLVEVVEGLAVVVGGGLDDFDLAGARGFEVAGEFVADGSGREVADDAGHLDVGLVIAVGVDGEVVEHFLDLGDGAGLVGGGCLEGAGVLVGAVGEVALEGLLRRGAEAGGEVVDLLRGGDVPGDDAVEDLVGGDGCLLGVRAAGGGLDVEPFEVVHAFGLGAVEDGEGIGGGLGEELVALLGVLVVGADLLFLLGEQDAVLAAGGEGAIELGIVP